MFVKRYEQYYNILRNNAFSDKWLTSKFLILTKQDYKFTHGQIIDCTYRKIWVHNDATWFSRNLMQDWTKYFGGSWFKFYSCLLDYFSSLFARKILQPNDVYSYFKLFSEFYATSNHWLLTYTYAINHASITLLEMQYLPYFEYSKFKRKNISGQDFVLFER